MKIYALLVSILFNYFVLFLLGSKYFDKNKDVNKELLVFINNSELIVSNKTKNKKNEHKIETNKATEFSKVQEVKDSNSELATSDVLATNTVEDFNSLKKYLIELPKIEYPKESLANKEVGTVKVFLSVAKDLKTLDVKIVSSSGYKRLDNSALLAIRGVRLLDDLPKVLSSRSFLIDVVFEL